jgi:hypothetical protein
MDSSTTAVLIGAGTFLLATIKPVISAYAKALERKANQMYTDQPAEMPHEERRQKVVKALGKSMIGYAISEKQLEKYVPTQEQGERLSSIPVEPKTPTD